MIELSAQIRDYINCYSDEEDPVLKELYRQTNLQFTNPRMASGYIQGSLLTMISKMLQPEKILEIGTFTGYSAICLAKGLSKDGTLTTIEIDDELEKFATTYFKKAGLHKKIDMRIGDAKDIIPTLHNNFDIVFMDAEKTEYKTYYNLFFDKLKKGGIILADNVLWGIKTYHQENPPKDFIAIHEFNEMIKKDKRVEKFLLPIRDGVFIIRKI